MVIISSFLRYLIAILLLIPMYSCALLIGPIYKPAGWFFIANWNHFFLKLFGVEVVVEYEDPNFDISAGGIFIGLNQQSILDPIMGPVAAPKVFMSIWNIEYALIPFVGWVSWIYGWVIIRQWPKQAKRKLEKAKSYLRNGGFVYSSIEGKRSKDGSLSPFKKGPVVLAIQSAAKIFPLVVYGSKDCLPYGEWKIRPGKVTIKFLKAIPTEGMSYEDRNLLINQLRELAKKEMQL
jgi:1-acyl-sn-glycerol-3-phosphate acyltransferase